MSENVTLVDGNGSVARVAFDLAARIAHKAIHHGIAPFDSRKEFLDLYAECYEAAQGNRRPTHD